MLGAMIGVREGTHFDVDVWPELKPRDECACCGSSRWCSFCVFALVFVWYGYRFLQFGWNQTSELADLPMGWIFAAWPLTGLTWFCSASTACARTQDRDRRPGPATTSTHAPDRHGSVVEPPEALAHSPRAARACVEGPMTAMLTPGWPRSGCSELSSC
jgi:TRAP-type C4-dicarboxylate transport system permease small subunit